MCGLDLVYSFKMYFRSYHLTNLIVEGMIDQKLQEFFFVQPDANLLNHINKSIEW